MSTPPRIFYLSLLFLVVTEVIQVTSWQIYSNALFFRYFLLKKIHVASDLIKGNIR